MKIKHKIETFLKHKIETFLVLLNDVLTEKLLSWLANLSGDGLEGLNETDQELDDAGGVESHLGGGKGGVNHCQSRIYRDIGCLQGDPI